MIEILNRFLFQHKSISIPGLGTIHAERFPARLNTLSGQIEPPGHRYKFDKYFDAPDKEFFTYLSMQQGVPDYEAIRLYNQFAQDFRAAIMLEEKASWPGIGDFKKNSAGEIEFVQSAEIESGFLPITIPPTLQQVSATADEPAATLASVTDETTSEQLQAADTTVSIPDQPNASPDRTLIRVGWGLLAACLLGLALHFGTNGFNMKSVGNRQAIPVSRH